MIGNMHNLIHLADDVQYMNCPISKITAYPFENALGKLKKLIRQGRNPLSQLCRRLSEMEAYKKKPMQLQVLQILRQLKPNDSSDITVKRLRYKNEIIVDKYPNNIVLLANDRVSLIDKILLPAACNIEKITVKSKILKKRNVMFTQAL